ncbi:OB-fold domain-containing protein [Nocardioides ginsengisoli]|uniref:Zn-ribbon domain-containing OB-fold protein n=1 Tax=Nocardioides ginsengisoli TaxID=363868 RepID=A0ABW3VVP6_9ACTN
MVVSIPVPHPSEDSRPFWDSLRDHVLRLPWCGSCASFQFPPMPGCPACSADADAIEWREVAGAGRIHSWFVARHAFHPAFESDLPYVVADVVLDEGPRINGRIVGVASADVQADMRVRAVFEDLSAFTRLAFEPADPQEQA